MNIKAALNGIGAWVGANWLKVAGAAFLVVVIAPIEDWWVETGLPGLIEMLGQPNVITSALNFVARYLVLMTAAAGFIALGYFSNRRAVPAAASAPKRALSQCDKDAVEAGKRGIAQLPATQLPALPEHEVTRRIKALDDLREAIETPANDASAKAILMVGNHRHLLLDIEDGKQQLLEAIGALPPVYQQIKRDVAAFHDKYGFALPPIVVNGFRGADRFFDVSSELYGALDQLHPPYTNAHVTLLKPWLDAYVRDTEPFRQWVKDCSAQLKVLRANTLERMRQ